MKRTVISMSIVAIAMLTAACGGAAPAGTAATTGAGAPTVAATAGGATQAPVATPATTATAAGTAAPTDVGGLPANDLSVEQLCAALTAEEMSAALGTNVTIDPGETEWCGYDSEDGSGMFLVSRRDTAEEFIDQAKNFDCDTKNVEPGAVLSSCGNDKEDGRPSEAWFLLNGTGVQLSVNTDATEAQYLEMIRQALD